MFSNLITRYRMSQAAVVVQNLLEMHHFQNVSSHGANVANSLVQHVYDEVPDLVSGKRGTRPHKLTLAAAALAKGVVGFASNADKQRYFCLSLGTVLVEITGKPQNYALSSVDHSLLAVAQDVYLQAVPPDLAPQ